MKLMKVLMRVGFSVVGFLVGKFIVVLLPVWAFGRVNNYIVAVSIYIQNKKV